MGQGDHEIGKPARICELLQPGVGHRGVSLERRMARGGRMTGRFVSFNRESKTDGSGRPLSAKSGRLLRRGNPFCLDVVIGQA